jgi:glutathione S-transferase
MRIYWIKAQAPRRVLALAKYLGIEAEFVEVDLLAGGLKSAEYLGLNPNGKAPTLVDGDLLLWEASAIMAHLAIKAGSDMWPAHDPVEQVEVLRWLSWNDCHWSRELGPFNLEHVVKAQFGFGAPDRAGLQPKIAGVRTLAKVLDGHLKGRNFVACGRLTIADFQLASIATDWRVSELPFESFSNILRWLERLQRIPAWADPWPAETRAPKP